jgi:hypothetical protein
MLLIKSRPRSFSFFKQLTIGNLILFLFHAYLLLRTNIIKSLLCSLVDVKFERIFLTQDVPKKESKHISSSHTTRQRHHSVRQAPAKWMRRRRGAKTCPRQPFPARILLPVGASAMYAPESQILPFFHLNEVRWNIIDCASIVI